MVQQKMYVQYSVCSENAKKTLNDSNLFFYFSYMLFRSNAVLKPNKQTENISYDLNGLKLLLQLNKFLIIIFFILFNAVYNFKFENAGSIISYIPLPPMITEYLENSSISTNRLNKHQLFRYVKQVM